MRVLFVGAHPDDIEIGAGGALLKHLRRGDDIVYVVLSRGERGCPQGASCDRVRELLSVIDSLGLKSYYVYEFPDTRLHEHLSEIKDVLESIVMEFKPERVYTHLLSDSHQDHSAVARATKIACRRVRQVLSYWSPSTYSEFRPVFFIDITDVFSEKMMLLESYRSQGQKDYVKRELVYAVNRYMGFLAGGGFAEGFEVVRYVEL